MNEISMLASTFKTEFEKDEQIRDNDDGERELSSVEANPFKWSTNVRDWEIKMWVVQQKLLKSNWNSSLYNTFFPAHISLID